jgi:MoxR-like ATPase
MSEMSIGQAAAHCRRLAENIATVFLGKEQVVRQVVLALMADGHILLEDVPGVGKTLLAKAIARSIDGNIRRIQFTADLLPTDVTGVSVYNQSTGEFSFRQGPVFAHILLGDEINRATPRTQSSLLEAMEEKQVSVDGHVYPIEAPFFVIATQNPIELEGTYPLPFSQMDRFLTRLSIGYLEKKQEERMLIEQRERTPLNELRPVLDCPTLLAIQKTVRHIRADNELIAYLTEIIHRTRNTDSIAYGASPRAALDLLRFSQANALFEERDYLLPDDIKASAPAVLAHRIIVRKGARLASAGSAAIVLAQVESVPVPV